MDKRNLSNEWHTLDKFEELANIDGIGIDIIHYPNFHAKIPLIILIISTMYIVCDKYIPIFLNFYRFVIFFYKWLTHEVPS
jgi:hypothetical protein